MMVDRTCHFAWPSTTIAEKAYSRLPGVQRHERSTQEKPHPGEHSTIIRFGNESNESYRTIASCLLCYSILVVNSIAKSYLD